MKSDNNPGNSRNSNINTDNSEKGAYSNTIEVGSVGIEGGSDNGASTLRVLKKKHADDRPVKRTIKHLL